MQACEVDLAVKILGSLESDTVSHSFLSKKVELLHRRHAYVCTSEIFAESNGSVILSVASPLQHEQIRPYW